MSKTDEAVEAACRVVAVRAGEDWETMHEFMKGVIRKTQAEALRAALPVLLGPLVDSWHKQAEMHGDRARDRSLPEGVVGYHDGLDEGISDCAMELESLYPADLEVG